MNIKGKEANQMKLSLEEIKELAKITGVIEEKRQQNITNLGYKIDGTEYVYGKLAKSELGFKVDIDGDKLIDDLLYAYMDHNKKTNEMALYKVSEEDIEDL